MERTSLLLLGLEALPASLLLCFGANITVNKGFLNTNTAITPQLMQTARRLEAEWRHVLWGSVGMGTKEDESSTYICMYILGAFGLLDFTMLRPVLIWGVV
jgi:hypothetical protein